MRNPKRIDEMCEELKKLWKLQPDTRLGQLICNTLPQNKLFYIEDEDALELIKAKLAEAEDRGKAASKRAWSGKMKIVSGEKYTKEITDLISEYNKALGRDLSFQGFDEEMKDLAVKYSYPNGRLLCALTDDATIIGCVAYHRHSDKRCEMKRLFVKPEYRELHAGRKLIEAIIEAAKADGFEEMVLDTITPLQSAIHLYKKYGFEQCEPYYDNPMNDVVYMKKKL